MFGKSFIRVPERLQEQGFTGSQDKLIKDQNTDEEEASEQHADPTGSCLDQDQFHGYYRTGHIYKNSRNFFFSL